jgi:hypothetical protein
VGSDFLEGSEYTMPGDREKINTAVRECLQQCYGSKDSIAALADFVAKLKDSVGWDAGEIHAVELAVLRMLGSIVHGAIYSGDATDRPISDQNPGRKATNVDGAQPP